MIKEEAMSPIRPKAKELLPLTPIVTEASRIHPSPNRTEAAAAMLHLLTGSKGEISETSLTFKPSIAKRRYVRKISKKVGTSTKRQIKTAMIDSNPAARGKPPVSRATNTEELSDKEAGNQNWRINNNDILIPFREYNRKDKSLGLLCENFLKLYQDDKTLEICLDQAATELRVERRRIYDIVNILDSIHLVSRKSKNLYNWHGLSFLPASISAMKQLYAKVPKTSSSGSDGIDTQPIRRDRRRGKSLSKLSRMFVQLFLEKENCIIPLDEAAKQLLQMEESENEDDRMLKTKIRRLYDVANVLVSVGLIEKLQLSSSRKPVFRWIERSTRGVLDASSKSYSQSVDSVNKPLQLSSQSTVATDAESICSSVHVDDTEIQESMESDMFDKGSDPQFDATIHNVMEGNQGRSEVSMSNGKSSLTNRGQQSGAVMGSSESASSMILLQLDANNEPIHPRLVLRQQQEHVKVHMEQYVREYVAYLSAQQMSRQARNNAEASPLKAFAVQTDENGSLVGHSLSPLTTSPVATEREVEASHTVSYAQGKCYASERTL